MDPSLVLEQTIQDVSNLPSEFRYLLEEIGSNDLKLIEEKKEIRAKRITNTQIYKTARLNTETSTGRWA